MAKDNIILVDFDVKQNWDFKVYLEKYTKLTWKIKGCKSNQLRTNSLIKIYRYLAYFVYPFFIFINRKKYNKIIAWQQFYGLIYAFFCRAFKVRKLNDLIIMTFIYKKKKGIVGYLYKQFMQFIVESKYIDYLVVFSEDEISYYSEYFNVSPEKFKFTLLGITDISEGYVIEKGERMLACGRSNRDYKFLIDALNNTDYEIDILCDVLNIKSTSNITIYNNIAGQDYFNKLSKCFCVLLSLENEEISSGQLVILQAMAMGKPVIVTKAKSLESYLHDYYNARIIDKDIKELHKALSELHNNEIIYKTISENARLEYLNKYSEASLARSISRYL